MRCVFRVKFKKAVIHYISHKNIDSTKAIELKIKDQDYSRSFKI